MSIPVWISLIVLALGIDSITVWLISDHAYEKGRKKGRAETISDVGVLLVKIRTLQTELSVERRQNKVLREKYRSLRAKYPKCRKGVK